MIKILSKSKHRFLRYQSLPRVPSVQFSSKKSSKENESSQQGYSFEETDKEMKSWMNRLKEYSQPDEFLYNRELYIPNKKIEFDENNRCVVFSFFAPRNLLIAKYAMQINAIASTFGFSWYYFKQRWILSLMFCLSMTLSSFLGCNLKVHSEKLISQIELVRNSEDDEFAENVLITVCSGEKSLISIKSIQSVFNDTIEFPTEFSKIFHPMIPEVHKNMYYFSLIVDGLELELVTFCDFIRVDLLNAILHRRPIDIQTVKDGKNPWEEEDEEESEDESEDQDKEIKRNTKKEKKK